MSPMNLVVYLARAGLGSRRSCDELIKSGVVTVNGEEVTFPRHKVGEGDVVAVRGEVVEARQLRYVLLNKPRGVASTRSDPHAERVVVDLVPNGRALFPVGRLDLDTTGLLILTNDGVLANRLLHPRYGVPKTYAARVRGKVSRRALAVLRSGVELEDGLTSPAEVTLKKQSAKTALVELTIHEGRKRQVRRMLATVGLPVEELHRRRFGPLTDKGLDKGAFRELNGDEIDALRRAGEEVQGATEKDSIGEPLTLAAEPIAAERAAEPLAAERASEPIAAERASEPLAAEPSADELSAGPPAPEALASAEPLAPEAPAEPPAPELGSDSLAPDGPARLPGSSEETGSAEADADAADERQT
jgi:23S rRNA pseudouridine2605 synthase